MIEKALITRIQDYLDSGMWKYEACYLDKNDLKAIIGALAQKQWIPVSERLPKEEEKSYWICTDNGYQCECRWTNINHIWTNLTTDWHWHLMDIPPYSKVVAWMPLPESYQPQEGSKKE